jgi:hypothetical protein
MITSKTVILVLLCVALLGGFGGGYFRPQYRAGGISLGVLALVILVVLLLAGVL